MGVMRERLRRKRIPKWAGLVWFALVAGSAVMSLLGWYPSEHLGVWIWMPVLLLALPAAWLWWPERVFEERGSGVAMQPLLWPKGRMARAVRVGFALGCLLIAFSPIVCNYNDRVHALRREGVTTSYFMRQDVAGLFIEGGMYLVLACCFAIWRLRRIRGDWAQGRASLEFLAPYVFLAKPIASAMVALPFVFVIYDTKVVRDPMSLDRYHTLKMMSVAVLIGVAIVLFLWTRHRFKLPDGIRNECCQCGYNLTGNTSGVCPECATKVEV